MRSMCGGEVSVVDRCDGATFDFFDVVALNDPRLAQRRQTLLDVQRDVRVAPRATGVVNADGFVDFDFAGDRFRGGERDFAKGDADVGVKRAGDENFAGVGKRCGIARSSTGSLDFARDDSVFHFVILSFFSCVPAPKQKSHARENAWLINPLSDLAPFGGITRIRFKGFV